LAFLGDFGKFFGLGSSKQVLGDVGGSIGSLVGLEGAGRNVGEFIGQATSSVGTGSSVNLSPLSTADQALEQSAVSVSQRGDVPQETSTMLGTTGMAAQQAFIGGIPQAIQGLRSLAPSVSKFFGSPAGSVAIGTGTGLGVNMLSGSEMRRMKPVLTQSRRNKARVRQLANFVGIAGAAQFLSEASGKNVTEQDVINLLLRTFRNDGAYITKAQVRNLRRTTNRFKSLEKQVKEATSMTRTTRRPAMRRASSTTLIKN
tara:strand:- start:1244 stop:2017 length:774 start_codon:yes stop_codon:yes gene_type:complete